MPRDAPSDRLARLQHSPGSSGRAHRGPQQSGPAHAKTRGDRGHKLRLFLTLAGHQIARRDPHVPTAPTRPYTSGGPPLHRPSGSSQGTTVRWYAFWLHCRCEALVLELTEPHGDRTRFVCLKQLMNPGRTHAGGTRDLPDRQPGLLSRHNSPDPFALGVGQPRQARRSRAIIWCSRRTHCCKASGVSMPGRIAVFPPAVQKTERLHPTFCASATHPPFPLVHPTLSWSQPKIFDRHFQPYKNKRLHASEIAITIAA